MEFATRCYHLTNGFPSAERFGLAAQLQRAAVGIPSNIAEEHGRGHVKDFTNHFWMADGSPHEVETQLMIAERPGYLGPDAFRPVIELAGEVGRLITGLHRSLERLPPPNKPLEQDPSEDAGK